MSELIFSDDDIYNYYLSLKTNSFVILMGLSGSGKTKLALRFAKAMTGNDEDQYVLVPVEAGWVDNKYLLGYYNPLTDRYTSTPFLDIILRAHDNYIESIISGEPDRIKPYFIILDEMNLSKVEYYFSKLISVLETREKVTVDFITEEDDKTKKIENDKEMILTKPLTLHNEEKFVCLLRDFENIKIKTLASQYDYKPSDPDFIPPSIRLTPNLYITGTVNIDETTYMFSPKVLDRANSIELSEINIEKFHNMISESTEISEDTESMISRSEVIEDFTYNYLFELDYDILKEKMLEYEEFFDDFFDLIININSQLRKDAPHFSFGYRVINEMMIYIINALELRGSHKRYFNFALDHQLKQKILAKIHGMKSELAILFKSGGALDPNKYAKFIKFKDKIERMMIDLERRQFASYM